MKQDLTDLQEDFFHKLKSRGRGINTLKNYRTDLNCFNNYLLEEKKVMTIENFGIAEVENYGAFLERKYRSDNSKRRRIQALRIFFDYLVGQGHFPSNPVRILSPAPKFLDIPRPVAPKEVVLLWKHLVHQGQTTLKIHRLASLRNQIIFLLIYGPALKVSELAKLKREDLFLERKPRVLIGPLKRDPYSVPLPPLFRNIFFEYDALLSDAKREANLSFSEILFNANPFKILSGGLSPRGIEVIFKSWEKKLNIKLTPKALRQSCIFRWLEQGHSESLIKEWLGLAPAHSLDSYKEHLCQYSYKNVTLDL